MEHLFSHDFLERFRSGQKEFSGIVLQFCDFSGADLQGLVVKDSKIDYVAFRHSSLKDARFINCSMFFASFYGADLESTVFDKCRIEMGRFDSASLKNTKITNSILSYNLIVNANAGELDLHNSAVFRLISNPESITDEEVLDAMRIIGSRIEGLPIEMRSGIQKRITGALKEFDRDVKLANASRNSPYMPASATYSSARAYHAMNNLGDEIIKYGNSEIYKSKKRGSYSKPSKESGYL